MMSIKNKNHNAIVAMSILLMLLAVLWFVIIDPYVSYLTDKYEALSMAKRQQVVLNSLIKNKSEIIGLLRSIKNNRSLSKVYISSNQGVVADVKLQGLVKRVINEHKGILLQSSVLKNRENIKSVSLKVMMRGNLDDTYKIIHELENGWPVLTLDNVVLRSQGYKNIKDKNIQIDAQYEVTAYVE